MPRYADIDALLKEFDEAEPMNWNNTESEIQEQTDFRYYRWLVENTPTADVVEVKHGEWIDKPTGAYSRMQSWCTVCGKHSGVGGIESNRHKPYCPNCGAKMDGGKNEQNNRNL